MPPVSPASGDAAILGYRDNAETSPSLSPLPSPPHRIHVLDRPRRIWATILAISSTAQSLPDRGSPYDAASARSQRIDLSPAVGGNSLLRSSDRNPPLQGFLCLRQRQCEHSVLELRTDLLLIDLV